MGNRIALLTSGMIGLLFSSSTAWAEENLPASSDEIIVTAQRREQSVLSVPLSIQAMSGEQLQAAGIRNLTSIQQTTPGYLPQTDSGFTQVYIRGIGNNIYIGADPSVATFVDDVPRIYGSTADNLFAVERVEVLKGAQGGLYGRNATGGVINIITRQPIADEAAGELRLGYGEKKTFQLAGYLNLPLSETAALNLSAERDTHDAYVNNKARRNPYTAANFPNGSFLGSPQETAAYFNSPIVVPKVGDQDFWAISGKLLLKPTDTLKVVLAADAYDKHDNNGNGTFNDDPATTQAALVGLYGNLGINLVLPSGFVQGSSGKFDVAFGPDAKAWTREHGVSATITWEVPGVTITSITAYRDQHTTFDTDKETTNVTTLPLALNYHKRFFYQEIRGVSSFDRPLRLVGGATYLDNRLSGNTDVFLLTRDFVAAQTAVSDKIKNWSIYGEVGYDITPELSLTVSGRYIHETNEASFTLPVVSEARTTQSKFVPSATLSYDLDGGTVYARWARGFKSGGINLASAPAFYPRPEDGSIFTPETVDTYEVGYRQSLFDRKVQITSAIFYNDYKNLQVDARSLDPTITTAIINAKSARTWGVESSINWKVLPVLTVGVNAGYLNAKYRDFRLSGSTVLAPFDQSGDQMPKAPKWQASFTASLDQPVTDDLRLVGNLLVSHTSRILWMYSALPGILPNQSTSGVWLTNVQVGVRTSDDKYGFSVRADNLFNVANYTYGQTSPLGNLLGWGSPRIIRGEVSAKF